MSNQWLEAHAPGYGQLPEQDREVIVHFAFLWTLFESQVLACNASATAMQAKVKEWDAAGALDADLYGNELAYFRNRYFADADFTDSFRQLSFRKCDRSALVRAVINGSNNDPGDRMLTVLLIVWRFRNNLFHGEKWTYRLQGQFDNFTCANTVLMRILEHHGHIH